MLIIVILSVSHVLRFATPWTAACQVYLSSTISWSLLRLMSVDLVMQSNQLILCHPLLLLAVYPSIRGFSNELAHCIRWLKYWSFSNSPSNEYSGLISFRKYIQHYNLKLSILWHSAFSVDQLSHLSYADCVYACAQSCLTLCDPMDCRLPWDFLSKSTGVNCHFLLQGIFLT